MPHICSFSVEILSIIFQNVFDEATGNGRWVGASICHRIRQASPPSTLYISDHKYPGRPPHIRYLIPTEKLKEFLTHVQAFNQNRSPSCDLGTSFGHIRAARVCVPMKTKWQVTAASILSEIVVKSLKINAYRMNGAYIAFLGEVGERCKHLDNLTLVVESASSALCFPYADSVLKRAPVYDGCKHRTQCLCSEWTESDGSWYSDASDGAPEICEKAGAPRFCLNEYSKDLADALATFTTVQRLTVDCSIRRWTSRVKGIEGEMVELRSFVPRLEFYSFKGDRHGFFHNYKS